MNSKIMDDPRLDPRLKAIFGAMETGAGGEVQLTDAIAREISEGDNVYGFRFKGQRFDCGSKAGFLQATVAFGLAREDLRDEFQEYLSDMSSVRSAAE